MDLKKKVTKIMSTSLTTVGPDTPVEEMKALLNRRSFHHLPVESKTGEIIGIVSSEDVSRIYSFIPSTVELMAKHIMTVDPKRISSDISIGEVLCIFLDNRFRALPVVDDDNKLLGIVTPYDFLELIFKD